MEKATEQITTLLRELAAQLGHTAASLWPKMVLAHWATALGETIGLLVGGTIFLLLALNLAKRATYEGNKDYQKRNEGKVAYLAVVSAVFAALWITALGSLVFGSGFLLRSLIEPEGALVLKLLGK